MSSLHHHSTKNNAKNLTNMSHQSYTMHTTSSAIVQNVCYMPRQRMEAMGTKIHGTHRAYRNYFFSSPITGVMTQQAVSLRLACDGHSLNPVSPNHSMHKIMNWRVSSSHPLGSHTYGNTYTHAMQTYLKRTRGSTNVHEPTTFF